MMLTVIKSQARGFRQHLRRKLTSEVRQPELAGSNNGNACEFDDRPNDDVDRIWAFRLFPMQPLLTEAGTPIHLGSRTLDVLVALFERPGELVSKEELMAKVWPNTCVVLTNIAAHSLVLRRALSDGFRGIRYVVHIPGRGCCFVAAITVVKDLPSEAAGGAPVREHNLPDHSASAVGRAETVHEHVQKLQQRRLLTIVGSGGSSTTIAFPLADKLIEAQDSGVWFVGSTPRRCRRSRTGHPDLTPGSLTSEVRRKTCAHPSSPN